MNQQQQQKNWGWGFGAEFFLNHLFFLLLNNKISKNIEIGLLDQ
jgi:hypothetical protein